MPAAPAASQPFAAGANERRKLMVERLARGVLMAVTASLVAPLVAILAYLLVRALPVLSWSLLLDNPRHYMTAGGLWAPLVGTLDVVILSLALAAPVGVLAGIYLNEYAREGWGTRLINLAIVNLAGVPSIVHALFGVGMFVVGARFGRSVPAASCTLAVMTLTVIIASTKEALAAVPFALGRRAGSWGRAGGRPSVESCCPMRSAAFSPG